MAETVLITLRADKFAKDFELPWTLPLKDLCPRMLEVLKTIKPSQFNRFKGMVFEKDGKGLVELDATLADYGVCTGNYLDIAEEEKYFG